MRKNLATLGSLSLVVSLIMLATIVAAPYMLNTKQDYLVSHSVKNIRPNVGATDSVNVSTSSTGVPPPPDNGSTIQPATICANFSLPQRYSAGSVGPTLAPPSPLVNMIVVQVLCNGCTGVQSDKAPFTIVPQGTAPQWTGTYGTVGASQSSEPVSGICDASFGLVRPDSSTWQISWSFQRLTTSGTLEVSVLLYNNQTIVFDKSASGPLDAVSGSLTVPAQVGS